MISLVIAEVVVVNNSYPYVIQSADAAVISSATATPSTPSFNGSPESRRSG